MIVTIDVPDADALVFFEFLNNDEGIREGAVRQLLQQHRPPSEKQWTTLVSVLGNISAGFAAGIEQQGLFDHTQRAEDIKQLAGL